MLILLGNASANWTITEIQYDPDGTDTDREWIELYGPPFTENISFFEDGGIHSLTFIQGNCITDCNIIIADNHINFLTEYLVPDEVLIYDSSWISLKNTGEEIGLTNNEEILISQNYPAIAQSTQSIHFINNEWISKTPNPGIWESYSEIPEFGTIGIFFTILASTGIFVARRIKM